MEKRKPYKWGVKAFLANVAIGETVEVPTLFRESSVRSIACKIFADFGAKYSFRHENRRLYVTRKR